MINCWEIRNAQGMEQGFLGGVGSETNEKVTELDKVLI